MWPIPTAIVTMRIPHGTVLREFLPAALPNEARGETMMQLQRTDPLDVKQFHWRKLDRGGGGDGACGRPATMKGTTMTSRRDLVVGMAALPLPGLFPRVTFPVLRLQRPAEL